MSLEKEYLDIVQNILDSDEFQKRKKYRHHENESVYEHCIEVSYLAYRIAKKYGCDSYSAAIGGLLQDFYPYPWQFTKEEAELYKIPKKPRNPLKQHGFVHAREALENARKFYPEYLNPRVENIIIRHMFPLNLHPPRYIESWIVTFADKYVSARVLKHPKSYYKYLGLESMLKKVKRFIKR